MSRMDERMAMLEGELDNLRYRIAQLEQENRELRQRQWTMNPYQPIGPGITENPWNIPKPYIPKSNPAHPEFKKECPKCGIKLENTMGYSCTDSLCPVFSQVKC